MSVSYTINNVAHPYTTATAGSTLSYVNGTTATWTQPNSTFQNSNGQAIMTIPHGESKVILDEKATLDVKGNVKINGLDLEERLTTIEKVLNIPQRDVILETKYPKLKQLHDEYMRELEKYKTFERLKGDNND